MPRSAARQVLAKVDFPALYIKDPSLVPALRYLRISSLYCRFARGYGNIDYIRELPGLTSLDLFDRGFLNLAPIADHPSLERLILRGGARSADISPLGRSSTLKEVELAFSSITYIRQLRELANIRELQFIGRAPVDDVLSNLAPALRLDRLGFWEARWVRNLDDFLVAEQLAKLRFLLLGSAHALESIAGVERWAATMTGIYLHSRKLADVERLASLELLEFANLAEVPICSLDFLKGKSRLRVLHVGGDYGPVPDLAPLGDLPALRHLIVWGSGPVDLSGLAQAGTLYVVVVGANRVVQGEEKLPASVVVRRKAKY